MAVSHHIVNSSTCTCTHAYTAYIYIHVSIYFHTASHACEAERGKIDKNSPLKLLEITHPAFQPAKSQETCTKSNAILHSGACICGLSMGNCSQMFTANAIKRCMYMFTFWLEMVIANNIYNQTTKKVECSTLLCKLYQNVCVIPQCAFFHKTHLAKLRQ